MDINLDVKAGNRIRSFYLFFIIISAQISVGITGIPKFILKETQQDAWISILIAFVYMLIVVTAMFFMLTQYQNTDIFGIQVDIFGKWIGKLLGTIYIMYFTLSILAIMLTYIQIIQIFIYPTMSSFVMAFLLLTLVVYSVLGGIRVIVGVIFIFTLLSSWILFLLYDPISRMEMTHLLPIFQSSIPELLKGARASIFTFLGIEAIFVIFPFIENRQDAKRSTILGICASTLIVLLMTMISIGYYSSEDFEEINWSVLRLFKGISLPMIERLDYVVVVEWMMVTLPTIILIMWMITRGMKRMYKIKQKTTLYIVAIILLIICGFIEDEHTVEIITEISSVVGFWIVFVYPLILLPFVIVKMKWRKHKGSAKE